MAELKEELQKEVNRLIHRPFTLLQAAYHMKGVDTNYRFGYSCEETANIFRERANKMGCESFTLRSKDVPHISSLSIDRDGKCYLADPTLLIKNVVDITEIVNNPGETICVDSYSEVPGEEVMLTGVRGGFQLSRTTTDWYLNSPSTRTFEYQIEKEFMNTTFRDNPSGTRIAPIIRVVDCDMEEPKPLSIFFTQDSHYVKGYDGRIVNGNTEKLERRVLELIGGGIGMQDLADYTDNCAKLYGQQHNHSRKYNPSSSYSLSRPSLIYEH